MRPAIGVLGDGQLAQMTCLAGRELGCEMHVYAGGAGQPAALVADRVWIGDPRDEEVLTRFARAVDAVVYDTELLPIESVERVARHAAVCPSPEALRIAQNRIREREFLRRAGLPMPRVAAVRTAAELAAAVAAVGLPAVLKTAEQGYDGRGQRRVERPEQAAEAWRELGSVECVLEQWVEFERECSVIVAGGANGACEAYPVIDNAHWRHILHQSSAPSTLPPRARAEAVEIALAAARELRVVGLLTVEMFHTRDGRMLVNELAPRPHNSGHHTQRSANVSQFAQLCRTAAGEPPLPVAQRPAAMVNLLGDLFAEDGLRTDPLRPPLYRHVGFLPGGGAVGTYFYGKREARPGRKMGHIIAVADAVPDALALAREEYEKYGCFPDAGAGA